MQRPVITVPIEDRTAVEIQTEVLKMLDDALTLGGRAMKFNASTRLLGALPELDSMAVVALIGSLEERFGITVDDDEINADTFASVGSLSSFVAERLHA